MFQYICCTTCGSSKYEPQSKEMINLQTTKLTCKTCKTSSFLRLSGGINPDNHKEYIISFQKLRISKETKFFTSNKTIISSARSITEGMKNNENDILIQLKIFADLLITEGYEEGNNLLELLN